MLTLTDDALAFIAERRQPIFIDAPQTIESCCLEITPCPGVRFGRPRRPDQHTLREIQGVEVFVPHRFPATQPLAIRTRRFLGRKFLFLDGWRLA
ncbi:MAG: hypothetical protein CGU28_15390 [Candidatus Dactylopiibacterium carminicum]|uniref:Uncharacterized protein n=1 Tax=Candidatus Dactylopiibacterium carminicum TaxID=857335 RepID=A0A272EN58_9RHOO|nr:CC/Se motif family (seleno)protein [Candidatus Dactylopiibacterium carminicum]KAF7597991.1 hypothetical protein BGI27_15670 [Candidatus Dactylopiibacterium carminicum]PAS91564.1 MAG: hypothetical protein CGU29_15715 [Candidatus Dactylopiibacterium carminicum]PAS93225.1 MAG: hypothetical protein CGU28_15390 [Candidatus Dactylopiibacterium carminicum]PAS96242.1 MAG: hypothetical protein BSR46_15705 [Candidatus Dactylopiibacterium carminicum]